MGTILIYLRRHPLLTHALLALIVFGLGPLAHADTPFSFATTPGELPKNVVPSHYDIHIEPDLDKFLTHGHETIDLNVRETVTNLELNTHLLKITQASLAPANGTNTQPLQVVPFDDKPIVNLTAAQAVPPGQYRHTLDFTGGLTEEGEGLFYVRYQSPGGKKLMLATQMEPTDARRMFPCWDEPVFRAEFDLTVILPENFRAYSNMPIERERRLGGRLKEVKFARTPPMASYLVALVAGELEEISGQQDGTLVRVVTTAGKKEQGRYALTSAQKLLGFYNQYFGIKYPLPKLDLLAIPGGFDGAMENWGAITFNESMVLFDPATSSESTKQDDFIVIAHEMAHQWFGDLVTMSWWENLWLNEGFASWMETKASDHFNPGWQLWFTAASGKSGVMAADARSTTHAIRTPVVTESQANDAFDDITYGKGAAFIRMLEAYLGEETFRQGIHDYLTVHEYSSTTSADLWRALARASGKPVDSVAAGWVEQPGFPVVSVSAQCTYDTQFLTLSQQRFTVHNPQARPLTWEIPVALSEPALSNAPTFVLLDSSSTNLPFGTCNSVLTANSDGVGYYRVSYDPILFRRLTAAFANLPPADRLNILGDTWAMVEADREQPSGYLNLTAALAAERTPAIWDQVIGILEFIDHLERGLPGRTNFQRYSRNLLQPQFARLGWLAKPDEIGAETMLRSRLISTLGDFGDARLIVEARQRFEDFLADPKSLPGDIRPAVVKLAGRYADQRIYDQLHELAHHARLSEDRQLYYRAMAAARNDSLARQTLALSLTNETVPQEATRLVIEVASEGEHPALAWDFAREHLQELLNRVDTFERDNYVPAILGNFSDRAHADELRTYARKSADPDAAYDRVRETVEAIRLKADLIQHDLPDIDVWVAQRFNEGHNQP